MKITNHRIIALLNVLGAAAYTVLIIFVMMGLNTGGSDSPASPFVFLMMFVLSATVVGSLILGRPLLMYIDGRKEEAVNMFIWTVIWLVVVTLIGISVASLFF